MSADVGSTLRVIVSATNAGGEAPATSLQSAVVAPLAPANTELPKISGTAKDGQKLTATYIDKVINYNRINPISQSLLVYC